MIDTKKIEPNQGITQQAIVNENKPLDVSIRELKKGMLINAYTSFHERYRPMDEASCQFIRHNFRKSKASITRNGEQREIPVELVKVGDSLNKIYSFPPELKKLQIVNEKLVKALKARGFLTFKVQLPSLKKEEKEDLQEAIAMVKQSMAVPKMDYKEHYKKAKEQAGKYIQTVKENITTRKKASHAIENIMDNARSGKMDHTAIAEYVDNITQNASAEAMSAIVSLKQSDQTYDHCIDVGVIFQSSYVKIIEANQRKSLFENESKILLAAFMHDFGKSKIPKDILDSTVRFDRDSQEMKLMESHPTFGAELLSSMNMEDVVVNMAHYHHVKQDTTMNSCYPKNVDYNQVIYESRLLSIVDAYQALVGRRKYKKSWNPPAAIRYIDALAGVEFDMDAWDDFLKVVGFYPKGSLVKLNDKSIGFVMSTPKEDLNRPQIAIVRNGYGEDLEKHTLVDLELEKDIEIVSDLDIEETFGPNAMQVFTSINIA